MTTDNSARDFRSELQELAARRERAIEMIDLELASRLTADIDEVLDAQQLQGVQ